MSTNKILLGVTAVLFAAGAAFASVNSASQTVYYWQNEDEHLNCRQVTLDINCDPVDGECIKLTPAGFRQLYSDNQCQSSMRENTGF